MGRYKEYREPKRRGFDDDYIPQDRVPEGRPINSRPASQATQAVAATVKWFNAEKGYGFITVAGGPEAFIHIRQLEAAGHRSAPEGARVKVRLGQGQKGPEVTEVIEVETAPSTQVGDSISRTSAQGHGGVGMTTECVGSVKMYKAERGFGFVGQDGGGKDVFVHATTLVRGGLAALAEGQRVRMQIAQGQKGLEARSIALLD